MACACAGDRKQEDTIVLQEAPLNITWPNQRIFSIENYEELGEVECEAKYKNAHEVRANLELTKSNLIHFFKSQLDRFPRHNPQQDQRSIISKKLRTPDSLKKENPTILVRMIFANQANNIHHFLRACFDLEVRKQWDCNLTDHFMCGFVVNNNMIVIEEEAETMVKGYSEREAIYKRFYWKDSGRFYVYQSSVPDEIHPDETDGRDDATRFDLVNHTMCFRRIGSTNDLMLEQIYQLDFRQVNSAQTFEYYF